VSLGTAESSPSKHSLPALDWLNFFLADVQSGVGPFLAIYLSAAGWNEQTIGLALTAGSIAGILAHTRRVEPIHRRQHRASLRLPRWVLISRGNRNSGVLAVVARHAGDSGSA
jgi:hypothetical protein